MIGMVANARTLVARIPVEEAGMGTAHFGPYPLVARLAREQPVYSCPGGAALASGVKGGAKTPSVRPRTSPRAKLVVEILAPWQQLNVLRRQVSKRRQLSSTDRFLFVWLARLD
jgi:hypothetical protein